MDYSNLTTLQQLATASQYAKQYTDEQQDKMIVKLGKQIIEQQEYSEYDSELGENLTRYRWRCSHNPSNIFNNGHWEDINWYIIQINGESYQPSGITYTPTSNSTIIPATIELHYLDNGIVHNLKAELYDSQNNLKDTYVDFYEINSYSLNLQDVSLEGM